MRELVIGVGQCGRRISEALASSMLDVTAPGFDMFNSLVENKRMDGIILIDLSDFQVPRELDRIRDRLSLKQFSLEIGRGAGAGANPEIGRKAAESRFPELYDQFLKQSTKTVEHINIINSGGGGTGAGAGPVIARKIIEEEPELKDDLRKQLLLTATVVLPHEAEDRRNKNAAITLSRYYGYVDGIIIADNTVWKTLPNYAPSIRGNEAKDTYSIINEHLASNLKWMNATDEILIKDASTFYATKTFESSDFRNPFTRLQPTGIIVPCYGEYDVNCLDEFSILTLILHTLSTSPLVAISNEKPFESLIVFIGVPYIVKRGLGRFQNLERALIDIQNLQTSLHNYLKMPSNNPIDTVYIYSTALRNKIAISTWIINPYVEKLASMMDSLFRTAEREKKPEEVDKLNEAGHKLAQLIPYSEEIISKKRRR